MGRVHDPGRPIGVGSDRNAAAPTGEPVGVESVHDPASTGWPVSVESIDDPAATERAARRVATGRSGRTARRPTARRVAADRAGLGADSPVAAPRGV
jgi:hypothetical protein